MSWTVYVIKSESTGKYYKGSCEEFDVRLKGHNAGKTGSTRHGRPWAKHYVEEYATKTEALKRERFFKTRSGHRWLKQRGVI